LEEEKMKVPTIVVDEIRKRIEDHLRNCAVDCGVSHTGLVKILFEMLDSEMISARHIAGSTRLALQRGEEVELWRIP
jgi:hypothetical protein